MHLPKNAFILFTLLIISSVQAFAYKNKKAVLLVNRDTQKDSIGYNFVSAMAESMQKWIADGKVVLWDSPEKKHTLKPADLSGIEFNTKTSFSELQNIFIYETWSASKKRFSFQVKGFSFASINSKGEEVLYGYVDYNSALKNLLANDTIATNANANAGTTLLQVLMNKGYDFGLVYFNDGVVADIQRSIKIQKHALEGSKKKFSNKIKSPPNRLVEYSIESGNGEGSAFSIEIRDAFQKFLNQNPQEFYNYGGDKILSYTKKAPIILTDLRVQEIWMLNKKTVVQKSLFIVPYVVGIPLKPIPLEQWQQWNFEVKGKDLEQILNEKTFNYNIKKVNSTDVTAAETEAFRKALLSANWDDLLQYKQKNIE